ncbi:uncharacterized protein LOC123543796 [Mercenaria mercenaria]|uniref:uncharacterized protein LOC123543796 n=1 Tax=Mercenaria mercenaria TaxID=6596 RepID=UPI00234F0E83|nr:uncharacterized protein LOC123543796 [Mercenaria mercenaria]
MEQTLKYWTRIKAYKTNNPVHSLLGTGYFARSKLKNYSLPFGAHSQELAKNCGLKDVRVAEHRPSLVPPWTLKLPDVDISLTEKVNKSDLPEFANTETKIYFEKYSGHLHIYTDGSKCPKSGKVASAVVVPSKSYEQIDRLTNNTSIYTAELLAIKNSMCWILANKPSKVAIFSVSLSSLTSLKSNNSQSRPELLTEIINLHNEGLNAGLEVTIVWCPAHIGISGNERADLAAKAGLLLDNITKNIDLSPTEVYSRIRTYILAKWQASLSLGEPKIKHIKTSVGLSRPHNYSQDKKVDKVITRLRLGTNLLPGNAGQYIMKIEPVCAQCRVKYDSNHLLLDCIEFGNNRDVLKQTLLSCGLNYTLRNILDPPKINRIAVFKALEKFILDRRLTNKI